MKNESRVSALVTLADGLGLHNGRREGFFLQRIIRSLGEIPRSFKPFWVLHEDRTILLCIRTAANDRDMGTDTRDFDRLEIGGPVTEKGTLLFGTGALIRCTRGERVWFELCPPWYFYYTNPDSAVFVPRAELNVNGGKPVLTTHFEG